MTANPLGDILTAATTRTDSPMLNSQSDSRALKGVLFALATSIVGSTAGAAGKLISEQVNVYSIVMIQYVICSLVVISILRRQGGFTLRSEKWKLHIVRSLAGWLGFVAFYAALASTSLVEVNLLRNTAPLFVPVVVWAWLRIVVPRNRWIPLIIGFIGVTLILKPNPDSGTLEAGYLLGLASGIGLAISMVGTRMLSGTERSSKIMAYYFFISLACSTPLGIYHWQPIPLSAWPYLLYIGISIYLALWLYTLAYSYAKPSLISPISYFSVVFSGLLGWIIWGFIPGLTSFVGIGFVVIAGIVTVYLSARDT